MANLPETSEFTAGIYQLEITDPVEGGVLGISNAQAKALANRTKWLKDNTWRTGDVKEVDCTNAYITANFDGTGLGTNERLGWAICNGQNGTKDRSGRVGLAYGTGYATMGATGGSPDAVVVAHSHTINTSVSDGGEVGSFIITSDENQSVTSRIVDTEGVSGTNKNMQPYIVTLFIQKL